MRTSPHRPPVFACCLFLSAIAGAHAGCLPGAPSAVRLAGVLQRTTFAGPPNYQSVHRGDAPETYFVLRLPRTVCLDDPAQGARSARRVQLFLQPAQYGLFRPRLGTTVTLSGQLWPAVTGHHHTPLMFTPSAPAGVR